VAIRFDLSSVTDPIKKATLNLQMKSVLSNGTGICTLFVITSDWVSKESSWFNAKNGTPWKTIGGDFNHQTVFTAPAALPDSVEIYDVTGAIKAFINGQTPNYGFIIEPATSPDLSIQMQDHLYYSSEYSDTLLRPSLVLQTESDGILNTATLKTFDGFNLVTKSDQIIISSKETHFSAAVFDMKGRQLTHLVSIQGSCSLDMAGLSKGVLLLNLKHGSFTRTLTIVNR